MAHTAAKLLTGTLIVAGCSGRAESSPTTEGLVIERSYEYPVGKVEEDISKLAIGNCIVSEIDDSGTDDARNNRTELFQVRRESDPNTGTIGVVYVFPVEESKRGNLSAPHEYWFSGGRTEDELNTKHGYTSIVDCPPVDEPKTHSWGGGFVEDHTGASVFTVPAEATNG